eukprot:gene34244-22023_t
MAAERCRVRGVCAGYPPPPCTHPPLTLDGARVSPPVRQLVSL